MSMHRQKTEAAPNSYTGSGRCLFPDSDGFASQSLPLGGIFGRHRAPETSPCHVQAKQNGELDLRRVACFSPGAFAAESRPRRTRHRQSANASAQFETGSARGQPRQAPRVRKPRSPARRPIQAYEVEPSARVSRGGIVSQIETHSMRSLFCASVRRPARHAGPRLVQLLSMIGISGRIG